MQNILKLLTLYQNIFRNYEKFHSPFKFRVHSATFYFNRQKLRIFAFFTKVYLWKILLVTIPKSLCNGILDSSKVISSYFLHY